MYFAPGVIVFQPYYLAYTPYPSIQPAGVNQHFAAPRPRRLPIDIRRLEELAKDL